MLLFAALRFRLSSLSLFFVCFGEFVVGGESAIDVVFVYLNCTGLFLLHLMHSFFDVVVGDENLRCLWTSLRELLDCDVAPSSHHTVDVRTQSKQPQRTTSLLQHSSVLIRSLSSTINS